MDHQIVVGWWLVLNYMETSPTPYYQEFSGQAAHMETHPQHTILNIWFSKVNRKVWA